MATIVSSSFVVVSPANGGPVEAFDRFRLGRPDAGRPRRGADLDHEGVADNVLPAEAANREAMPSPPDK